MTAHEDGRVATLHARLMESTDSTERARIHLELGRIALRDGRLDVAVRHFKEALLLDARLEAARQILADLGEGSRLSTHTGGRRAAVRQLLAQVGRRCRRSGS